MVTDAAATLPLAGRRDVPVLISVVLEAAVAGPFTGDPDDIRLTVDYSRVARFILTDLAGCGPFADARAAARRVADFTYALDPRVCAVHITIRAAGGGPPDMEFHLDREDGAE